MEDAEGDGAEGEEGEEEDEGGVEEREKDGVGENGLLLVWEMERLAKKNFGVVGWGIGEKVEEGWVDGEGEREREEEEDGEG